MAEQSREIPQDLSVPLFNSLRQYRNIKNEISNAINFVLESGCYVSGVATKTLEMQLAEYCGTKYAVAVSSGTAAIYLALLEAGVCPNDDVLVPSHTFIATIEAITLIGANPIYCDISPYTYNIRLDEIERKKTDATKAIITVHMYGNMCAMDDISSYASRNNIRIVEDACQAIGSEYRGAKAGSIGDFGCFSFYPTKNLGTYGEGGAIVTNSRVSYDNLIAIRNHNAVTKHLHLPGGFNFRISELQAGVLVAKLKFLDDWINRRREIASIYDRVIKDNVTKPQESKNNKHSYHLYVIRSEERDALCNRMEKSGIGFGIHYPIPCHTQYQSKESLPFTELVSRQILSIPMFPELTNGEVQRVCEVING